MSKDLVFEVHGDFECPFCMGTVTIGDGDDGGAVLHTLPMCDTFERMDAGVFVKQCLANAKPKQP